ncbi:MAG: hypothetical protein WCC84_15560 [Candidatus Cybelea sp.]
MFGRIGLVIGLTAMLSFGIFASCRADTSIWVRFSNQDLALVVYDVAVTDEGEDYMRVNRVYNSLSSFSNIFGFGWGSELDTNLVPRPDGELWYTGFGNGLSREFSPVYHAATDSKKMVSTLEKGALEDALIGSSDEQKAFETLTDPWYIMQVYKDMRHAGYLPPNDATIGAMFSDSRHGPARVVAVSDGYQIDMLEDSTQPAFEALFDDSGKLIRGWVHGEPQKFVSYSWGTINNNSALGERVITMADYRGNVFHFRYDGRGRVVGINAGRFGVITYGYDADGDLVWERDASSGSIRYVYDAYHDLTRIEYPHGQPTILGYEGASGRLISLQCSDGTAYEFQVLSKEGDAATSMRVVTQKGTSRTSETMNSSDMGVHAYC